MKSFIHCLLTWSLSLSLASAAQIFGEETEVASEKSGDAERLSGSFRVVGYGEDLFQGLKYERDDGEVIDLNFTPNRRSSVYRFAKGRERVEFFTEEISSKGKPIQVVKARANLPESEIVLLVFIYQGENARPLPFRTIAFDESPESFGPGVFRFLNLTEVVLVSQIGEVIVEMSPGFAESISFDPHADSMRFRVAVRARTRWKVVLSSIIQPDPKEGRLYILKPPLEENSLRLRMEKLW